jgi:hypothetical protein
VKCRRGGSPSTMLQVSALAEFRHPNGVGGLKPKLTVFSS